MICYASLSKIPAKTLLNDTPGAKDKTYTQDSSNRRQYWPLVTVICYVVFVSRYISLTATQIFQLLLADDLGIPFVLLLNSSHPHLFGATCFLVPQGSTPTLFQTQQKGRLFEKPCYLMCKRSEKHPRFSLCYALGSRQKKSPLNSWTILPANHPNTTAPTNPWTHVPLSVIQTCHHNPRLSPDSSTSRGRGGNQTNGKRQKGNFHLDQPGRLADSTEGGEQRFNVKDMKDVYSRQVRCWGLHLRERQRIKGRKSLRWGKRQKKRGKRVKDSQGICLCDTVTHIFKQTLKFAKNYDADYRNKKLKGISVRKHFQ